MAESLRIASKFPVASLLATTAGGKGGNVGIALWLAELPFASGHLHSASSKSEV
jgi:hypothetical protein